MLRSNTVLSQRTFSLILSLDKLGKGSYIEKMARITKAEKYRRIERIRQILACGGTRADCLAIAANEWGLKPRSADYYIHEANQQIVEDFNIDRKDYTAQLLQVLHRVMEKGSQTNQMGAVTAAVAQAMKLARLDH